MNIGIKRNKKGWDVVEYSSCFFNKSRKIVRGAGKVIKNFPSMDEAEKFVRSMRTEREFTTKSIMYPSRGGTRYKE